MQILTYLTLPAQSLRLTFLFFLMCTFKCQSGKSPGFMPDAEGSLPCHPQEEGVSGSVGGGNPQALIGLEQGAGVHLQHQLSAASGLCVFKVIFDSEIVVDS